MTYEDVVADELAMDEVDVLVEQSLAEGLARTADQVARAATATADRLAGLAVADVMSLATRVSNRAASTYRLTKYGQDAADVVADVLTEMLADVAAGTFPNVADAYGQTDRDQLAAVLAVRARRVADRYRRQAKNETVAGSAADVVDGPAATDQDAATATADRARAAVLARTPRNMAADRSDVLAVGDWARENMRSAETVAIGARDRAATLAAMAAPYLPGTATQRAAWNELTDQHGQDRPTVAVKVGRAPVLSVLVPAVAMPDRAAMRALRDADRYAARMAAAAERSRSVDPLAAAVAGAWRDAARAARLAHDAAIAHGGRAARTAVDWSPVLVDRLAPVPDVADVLAAGYQPETLAERASKDRPRGAVDDYRSVSWSAVLPTSTETARTAVAKAARGWSETLVGRRIHETTVNGQTRIAAPLVPVAVHACPADACQDRDGHQHGYQVTRMLAGRRTTLARAGGAAARAATAAGQLQRTAAAARDRLADRLAEILPVLPEHVPTVKSTGVLPNVPEPTTVRPYGMADYVVGSDGQTVTATAARAADYRAEWLARSDAMAADTAAWLADRAAVAVVRAAAAADRAADVADRARQGFPVRTTADQLREHVAAATFGADRASTAEPCPTCWSASAHAFGCPAATR